MDEVLIKGGSLIDGTGAPRRKLDVKIRDGRIMEVGDVKTGDATVIDADGLTVMPGLIEGHNHPLGEREFADPGSRSIMITWFTVQLWH